MVIGFGLMDGQFMFNNTCFLQSQALVLWACVEIHGDSFEPNPNNPRPPTVSESFDSKFMAHRKRDTKILECKLHDVELRAKAEQTMHEVRKGLKKCMKERKPPKEQQETPPPSGIPKEVKVMTPSNKNDCAEKK